MSALGRLVDATPADRDRVVDVARGASILVVVAWHWVFSVTFRTGDGGLGMSNPVHTVPGGWALSWVFQVMPVFILAGGYVNLLGWRRTRDEGGTAADFVRRRLRRLAVPVLVWAAAWVAVELSVAALATAPSPGNSQQHSPEHRWMWQWFPGYLTPLWFLGVYALLIAAAPATATLHRRHGARVLAALLALVVIGSVLDRAAGMTWAAWAVAALVWLFIHQLGYAWYSLDLGRRSLPARLAVAGVGLAGLIALTALAGYPRSLVSTRTSVESNIFPTNATIAALAVFQLGLLTLATPTLDRLLRRRRFWAPVVIVNAVALTIFVWHMTAFLGVIWAYERSGGVLLDAPTATWWSQRWLWLLAPGAALTLLVALFGRFERRAARR